jgi:cobalt-zinc-cadmium efflux system outer membrane protein
MDTKSILLAGLLVSVTLVPALPAFAQNQKQELVAADTAPEASFVPSKISLDQAISWGLKHSPALGASASRANAATANRAQAGALPNPELSIEAENIYGDGPYNGMGNAEITYGISQLVELPGKRRNRIRMAEAEQSRVHYMRDSAQLDLIRDITIAYAELVAAERNLNVIEEERTLAEKVRDSVVARVTAGKEPPIQRSKAQVELSSSDIALDRARRAVNARKQALATLMGGNTTAFSIDIESLPLLMEPESLSSYRDRLLKTPDIKGFEANITQAQSALSLERANALPDPTLSFGVRQFREDDRQAFIAGVSFPIPVFNANRAGVERAAHELNAAKFDRQSGQLSLESALTEAYQNYVSAYREANALKDSILPGAEEAFSFSRQGYDAGKFGYLEVLDAQRTLFEARRQHNEAILDYHRQRAAIERMTAVHAHDNSANQE